MSLILLASALTWIVAVPPAVAGAANEVTERTVPNSSAMIQLPAQPSGTTIPTLTVDQRLAAMQQQVQALQAQIAALQSVFMIAPNGAVIILSSTSVSVQAGTTVSIGAGQNISIQGIGTALVEGKGGLDLKGPVIKLNGGTKPLATVGSQVQVPGQPIGQISAGSGTILGN